MSDKPKVVSIGLPPSELAIAVSDMSKNMQHWLDYAKLIAEIRWAGYEAYLEQGFDEAQALELCKTITL